MLRKEFETITCGEWLSLWYDTYKKPRLKPCSLRNIEQMIRLHTPEWFKEMIMREITAFDADKALSELPPSRTAVYTRQVWHASFAKACALGIVDKNVIDYTERVVYKKQKSKSLTIAEQKAFFERLEKSRYKWLMLFYICTGVRRCEALSIEWSDINEEENIIHIKGTKTEDSDRHILLTPDIKFILNEQRKQNEREKEVRKRGRYHQAPESIVFPFSAQQTSREFKKLCGSHHLHELRHTFITRCCESGVNPSVCQQLVGHSTGDMIMNVYMHVMDEFKRKEAAKFTLFPKF